MKNRKIRVAMVRADLNQTQLASVSEVPRSTLNQIISGRINPTEVEKEKIAAALNSKVNALFT